MVLNIFIMIKKGRKEEKKKYFYYEFRKRDKYKEIKREEIIKLKVIINEKKRVN